jgi:hypothetical protein
LERGVREGGRDGGRGGGGGAGVLTAVCGREAEKKRARALRDRLQAK